MARSSDELHVWEGKGIPVGTFTRHWQQVSFQYDPTFPGPPISLNLPLDGEWSQNAPGRFLSNLLPDGTYERNRMRAKFDADSIQPFDLLDRIDTVGGLIFSKTDTFPQLHPGIGHRVTEFDLIQRIQDAKHGHGPIIPTGAARYSVAGGQGKFTLRLAGHEWYDPDSTHPSTHIFKPEAVDWPDSDYVENATMDLAEKAGVPTPEHGILTVSGERTYVVSRFDRILQDGEVQRIHCEDLLQGLGMRSEEKYEASAEDCGRLLLKADPTGSALSQFLQLLAFNTLSGNADAHAKNYSIYLDPHFTSVGMTPIYDAVDTRMWGNITTRLAMPINGKLHAPDITLKDWAAFGAKLGFPPDRMTDIIMSVAQNIHSNVRQIARQDLPEAIQKRFISTVGACLKPVLEPRRQIIR